MVSGPAGADDPAVNPIAILAVVGLGTLLTAMAGSTVTLALPTLGDDLGVSLESADWVVESYLIAITVVLLLVGRSADLLGHGRVYLTGFLLFGLTSVVCGLANSLALLVAGRIGQGLVAAAVMATGPALLTTTFPPSQRGRALGMVATATYLGLTIGPPVGGWLISTFGWRSVFFLNVPITIVIGALGWRVLPLGRPPRHRATIDWREVVLLAGGAPLFLVALAEGQTWGWTDPLTLGLGAAGLIAIGLFVGFEAHRELPVLALGLFRSRMFSSATISALMNYVALFVAMILAPYYLIEARGLESSRAGMILTAQPLAMAVFTSPAGWLSDRIGSRGLTVLGLTLFAIALTALSTIGPDTSLVRVGAFLALMGTGTGIFISPNSSALMGAAPRDRQGLAGALMAVARNLGMMFGVALGTSVFFAAGGETGHAWSQASYDALGTAFRAGAAVALFGAIVASLRGREPAPE